MTLKKLSFYASAQYFVLYFVFTCLTIREHYLVIDFTPDQVLAERRPDLVDFWNDFSEEDIYLLHAEVLKVATDTFTASFPFISFTG